ncbi:uncharacterized protein [Cherax quadricarinatus]|uniref:uncharacterized protein n=1 Tax=Cherax quadricarinatus TaxID=27406 RepID=UPI00387EA2C3
MTRHPARRCHLCGRLYPQDAAHHTFSCSFCGLSVCVANVTAHRRRCVTVGAGQYSKQMIRGAGQEERDQSVSSDESSTVTLPQEQVEPIAGPSGWRPAATSDSSSSKDHYYSFLGSPSSANRRFTSGKKNFCSDEEESEMGDDSISEEPHITSRSECFQGHFCRIKYSIPASHKHDPILFLQSFATTFMRHILQFFTVLSGRALYENALRIYAELSLILRRQSLLGEDDSREHYITFPAQLVTRDDISRLLRSWREYLSMRLETEISSGEGSGFILDYIKGFHIVICKNGVRGYLGDYIEYPTSLRGKNQIFNPRGVKNSCFIQCLAAFFCRRLGWGWYKIRRYLSRCDSLQKFVNYSRVTLPVQWSDIHKLESDNKISIFIYCLTSHEGTYHATLCRRGSNKYSLVVPLLLLGKTHVALIKHFQKYMRIFSRKHSRNKHFCLNCLSEYSDICNLKTHFNSCDNQQKLIFPPAGSVCKFKNTHKGYLPSHTAFVDLEAYLDNRKPEGVITARHVAIAYGYIVIDRNSTIIDRYVHRGVQCIDHMYDRLSSLWDWIKMNTPCYPLHMTREQHIHFAIQKKCNFCHQDFTLTKPKVRHHDHLMPKANYLGALCNNCNLRQKNSGKYLPVIIHNLSYDMALIIKELSVKAPINVLMKQGYKFLKVEIGALRFLDSLAFLSAGLASLAQAHIASKSPLKFTEAMISHLPPESWGSLLTGKQVFPYEYCSSPERLEEKTLPPKRAFYSSLSKKHISQEEFDHAHLVWEKTACQTLGDYLLVYLSCDVGLLADIFTLHRRLLYNIYNLDVVHYVSLPGFAYDAFLKTSGVELELITDQELYNIIQSNIRGGFTTAVRTFAQANNQFINPNFDEKNLVSKFLLYWDFNSLYGSCMTEALPYANIRKLSPAEMASFLANGSLLQKNPQDSIKGYWLLIDTLGIAPELARYTDDLPLCLYHKQITLDDLSEYSKQLLAISNQKLPRKNTKLVGDHLPKRNYLISLPLLQLFLEIGLQIEKIHSIYEFSQGKYLAGFVETNVRQRNSSTSKDCQRLFKLLTNSVFGKTLFNPSKYANKTKLITSAGAFLRAVSKPLFKKAIKLSENKVLVTTGTPAIKLTYPNYIGYQILELAKFKLYHFWYMILKKTYQDKIKLIYSDTDSVIACLEGIKNLTDEIGKEPLRKWIDTSNFPTDHPLYNDSRKGSLGLLKSEVGDRLISEIVCIKPKMYSILLADNNNTIAAKGVPQSEQQLLTHNNFRSVLEDGSKHTFQYSQIRNLKGQMTTITTRKRGLSSFDDKRFYLDAYHSVSYGHPDARETKFKLFKDKTDDKVEEDEEANSSTEEGSTEEEEELEMRDSCNLWRGREKTVRDFFPRVKHRRERGRSSATARSFMLLEASCSEGEEE